MNRSSEQQEVIDPDHVEPYGGPVELPRGAVQYTEQDIEEIVVILEYLLHKTPVLGQPYCIRQILDEAECWTSTYAKATHRDERGQHYHGADVTENPRGAYLRTGPLKGKGRRCVQRVSIRLVSHDQGWTSWPADRGTFRQSWTWFELWHSQAETGALERGPELCRNIHGRGASHHRTYVWDRSTSPEICEWLDGLQPGSTVAIVPHALYPGWVNNTLQAEIEVLTREYY